MQYGYACTRKAPIREEWRRVVKLATSAKSDNHDHSVKIDTDKDEDEEEVTKLHHHSSLCVLRIVVLSLAR